MRRLAVLLLLALCTAPAWAAVPRPAVVVVDTNRIMREAKAVADIARQVEAQGAIYGREFNAVESRLRQEDQALATQRGLLDKEAYKAKIKDLQEKLAEARGKAQRQRTLLDRARTEAVRKVQVQLQQVARDLAGELGANVVVQKAALVWADEEALEFTEDVLERLNEVLPRVSIELSR